MGIEPMKNILLAIVAVCGLSVLTGCFSFSSERSGSTTERSTTVTPVGTATTTTTTN